MPQEKYVFVYGAGIRGCGVAEVLTKNGKRVLLYDDCEKVLPQEFLICCTAETGNTFVVKMQKIICDKRNYLLCRQVFLCVVL